MEGKHRTVLIAMDGSDHSKYAFNWYLDNMQQKNDNVVVVHSVEYTDTLQSTQWLFGPIGINESSLSDLIESDMKILKEELEHYALMMKKANVNGTVRSVHAASPGEGVIKIANECGADLIITGSRGKGKIRRTFIGSTSDYIMHHSHVPVIVCRDKDLPHHHHHHFNFLGHHHHHGHKDDKKS